MTVRALRIRPEVPGDATAVRAVNEAAFEGPVEAGIVDTLRATSSGLISLVAEVEGTVVGHVLFSPTSLAEAPGPPRPRSRRS